MLNMAYIYIRVAPEVYEVFDHVDVLLIIP
jgi:hypothetical protein